MVNTLYRIAWNSICLPFFMFNTYGSNFGDSAGKRSISNKDGWSNLHGGWKTWVRACNSSIISQEFIISHDLQTLTSGEFNWLVILEEPSSNLWTFGIKQEGALLVWSLLEGFSQVVQSLSVRLVITVREVQSSDIHACVKHLDKHINIPAWWSTQKIKHTQFTYPIVQMTLVFLTDGSS